MPTCSSCHSTFVPTPGSRGIFCSRKCMGAAYKNRAPGRAHDSAFNAYLSAQLLCRHCQVALPYEKRKNSFCSKACAASFNNAKRPAGHASRVQQAESLSEKRKATPCPKKAKDNSPSPLAPQTRGRPRLKAPFKPEGPHTRIYLRTCPYSGQLFYTANKAQRHSSQHLELMSAYKVACRFTFSLRRVPKLFIEAADLVETLGWYSPANSPAPNPTGVSRDHLFSIHDGFRLGVPPAILRHPANCQLVPHVENQKKHHHSAISLSELLTRIAAHEQAYGSADLIHDWPDQPVAASSSL